VRIKLSDKSYSLTTTTRTTRTTVFFPVQKLYSIDLNTRKKKYKGKEHSHLEIAKLIELSGCAKQKKICK